MSRPMQKTSNMVLKKTEVSASIEVFRKDTYVIKNRQSNFRSFGCGLHRKPLIFQARQTTDRARPSGRGLACSFDRRLAVPRCRAR